MQVTATSYSATTASGQGTGQQVGQLGKAEFLMLLLAQLKNQDPLKPMEDTQFIVQLAQFTALEKMQELDDRMAFLLELEELGQANSMIGKEVEARSSKNGEIVKGTVTGAKMVEGRAVLSLGDETTNLREVLSVVEGRDAQLAQASSLIGKLVEARTNAPGQTVKGIVDSVKMVEGGAVLVIGDRSAKLGDVISVAEGEK